MRVYYYDPQPHSASIIILEKKRGRAKGEIEVEYVAIPSEALRKAESADRFRLRSRRLKVWGSTFAVAGWNLWRSELAALDGVLVGYYQTV